jgi:hypothetical protein
MPPRRDGCNGMTGLPHHPPRCQRALAETILHPQEIWEQWEWVAAREWMGAREAMALRRRYLALWDVADDERPALSVFEFSPKRWWTGVTTFVPEDSASGTPWQDYV